MTDNNKFAYLVGIGVSHSIAPPMHNAVAKSLGLPWQFTAQECPTIQDVVDLFRREDFAGGVVTMPYKIAIMQYLDELDDHAILIGACNNVYRAADGSLRGTNTDWRGVKGCLQSGTLLGAKGLGRNRPALLIGAGGAARAAVCALWQEFNCNPIYVMNRNEGEVVTLFNDTRAYGEQLELVHLTSINQAKKKMLAKGYPYFVVGTVPDFEPQTPVERQVRDILEHTFMQAPEKGILLDMCFKPRQTRTIKLAREHGWQTVEGTGVIGHQIEEQYRLWCGVQSDTPVTKEVQQNAWTVLERAADESKAINF